MSLAQLLIALVGPMALRVIASIGLGVMTFTGVDTAIQGLITAAQSNWSQLPADILSLAALARVPECMGLIVGALSTRMTMWIAASATRWITKA